MPLVDAHSKTTLNPDTMSTTDNLEQKAREWWLSKHPGFYEADERDVNVAVSFARSLAPPPCGDCPAETAEECPNICAFAKNGKTVAPPPAKELSDEEIEHIVVESIPEMSHVGLAPNDASALKMARAFMECGIRYARDNNYLAPTKEERPVVLAFNVIPDAEAITNDTDLDGHDRIMFELGVRTGLSHANDTLRLTKEEDKPSTT